MVRAGDGALAGDETGSGDGALDGDGDGATVITRACAAAGSGLVEC